MTRNASIAAPIPSLVMGNTIPRPFVHTLKNSLEFETVVTTYFGLLTVGERGKREDSTSAILQEHHLRSIDK